MGPSEQTAETTPGCAREHALQVVGYTLTAGALTLCGVLAFGLLLHLQQGERERVAGERIVRSGKELIALLVDVSSNSLLYGAGDAPSLHDYRAGVEETRRRLEALGAVLTREPEGVQSFALVRALVEGRIRESQAIVDRREQHGAALVFEGEEITRFVRGNDRLGAMLNAQFYPFTSRTAAGDQSALHMVTIVVSASFVLFGFVLFSNGVREFTRVRAQGLSARRELTSVRENEQRLAHLVEQSPLAVIVWNPDLSIREWNPAAERIFGWTAREARALNWRQLVPPDQVEYVAGIIQNIFVETGPRRVRNDNVTKDGRRLIVQWYNQPLYAPDGSVTGLITLCHDVTAEELAQRERQEAIDRLGRVFDATGDGYFEYNWLTNTITASPRWFEIKGFSPNEPDIYAYWRANCHPEDLVRTDAAEDAIRSGRADVFDEEYRFRLPDGRYRWVRSRLKMIRDDQGRPAIYSGATSDIDERKRLAERARADAMFIQQTLDSCAAGVMVIEANRTLRLCNTRAREILENESYPMIPGSKLTPWEQCSRNGVPLPRERYPHEFVIATGHTLLDYELMLRSPTGREVLLLVNSAPLLGADGHVEAVVHSFTDVTERERARAREAELVVELQHARRLEAIGNLASGVSHEFSNVLAAIRACIDSAREQAHDPDIVTKNLELIDRAARSAGELIGTLLRASHRGEPGPRAVFDLREELDLTARLVRRLLPAAISVETTIPDQPAWVLGVPDQLRLALLNLAINARDAMPDGGVLSLAISPGGEPPGMHTLTVTDTGVGIDPAHHARVFEPYFTTKPQGRGTGLGLSHVRGIIAEHLGTVSVKSAKGSGTSVVIMLPGAAAPLMGVPAQTRSSGRVALVAEDDEFVRSLIVTALDSMDIRAAAVSDGLEAVNVAQHLAGTLSCCIVDLGLPGLDGLGVIRRLRELRVTAPILVITGDPGVLESQLNEQRVTVLRKPFRIAALRQAVRDVLAGMPEPMHEGDHA